MYRNGIKKKSLIWEAAKLSWEHIADYCDDLVENLINAVNYVPLSVNLLAPSCSGCIFCIIIAGVE